LALSVFAWPEKKQKLTLVEINQEASEYAKENIMLNGLESVAEAVCLPAEKALEYISHEQVVMVDPPRAGLHQKLTDKLLEVLPKMIIYLSCNPATQARDLEQLMLKYQARDWRVYNFFPSTPHIESLIVLERI
jgi:23S rRNA (uracil1939-C5)-methyltransferase